MCNITCYHVEKHEQGGKRMANSVNQHESNFGNEHLNRLAKKIIEMFETLDAKEQEQVLWMIQGYNLAQKEEER